MKTIMIKVLAIGTLVGSMSGCATMVAADKCPALTPVTVPVDIVTAPVQMTWLFLEMGGWH